MSDGLTSSHGNQDIFTEAFTKCALDRVCGVCPADAGDTTELAKWCAQAHRLNGKDGFFHRRFYTAKSAPPRRSGRSLLTGPIGSTVNGTQTCLKVSNPRSKRNSDFQPPHRLAHGAFYADSENPIRHGHHEKPFSFFEILAKHALARDCGLCGAYPVQPASLRGAVRPMTSGRRQPGQAVSRPPVRVR